MARLLGNGDGFTYSGAFNQDSPYTIAAWCRRVDPQPNFQPVIASILFASGTPNYFLSLSTDTGVGAGIRAQIVNSNGSVTAVSPVPVSSGSWHHCASVIEYPSLYVSVDGYVTRGGPIFGNQGGSPWDTIKVGSLYKGAVAHFAVWRAALTRREVELLALGVSPLQVRQQSLLIYDPLAGPVIRSIAPGVLVPSIVGTPKVDADPVLAYLPGSKL